MERLLTRSLVDNLGGYNAGGLPVTSVYLGFEPAREFQRAAALSHLKDLVAPNLEKLLDGRSRSDKASIEGDIAAFTSFLEKMPKVDVWGLSMYSCSASKFFETVGVAMPFAPMVIVAERPAVGPLIAALDEYKRIAVCLVDRRGAKLYEYFMGRIEEVRVFSDDVPSRVKVGGWAGYEETKISRHVHQHEYTHYKNVSDVLYEQFRLRGFDWLFMGARPEIREEMERVLNTYVRERLKSRIDATPATSIDDLRRVTREAAERLKAEDNRALAGRLVEAASAGALAVTGLKNTLSALNLSAVGTLMVRENLSSRGVVCSACGMLALKRSECAVCGGPMTAADNIIPQAQQAAFAQGAVVRHVKTDSALDDYEGIGALTRFPLRNGA